MPRGFIKRNGIWYVRTDPLTGKPRSTGETDIGRARAVNDYRRRQLSTPRDAGAHETTLEEWAKKMIAGKEAARAPGTVKMYRTKTGHLLRILGRRLPIAGVTPTRVTEYVKQRKAEGAKNTTIAKELTTLAQIAKTAQHEDSFIGDPRALRPLNFTINYTPGERFLTVDELTALMKNLTPKRAARIAFAVATGARHSEAEKAQPEDVDLVNWEVRLRGTKTKGAKRTVPIPDPLRPLLLAAVPHLPLGVWGNMTRDLERACSRAKVGKVTSNDLRRTTGSWLVEAGVEAGLVARILGHRDSRMVEVVYGKMRPGKLGAVVNAQIAVTKTSQASRDGVEGGPQNPKKVRVAQSVEQRIEKPLYRLAEWAEAIEFSAKDSAADDSDSSLGDDESRVVRLNNVSTFVAGTRGRRLAGRLVEATGLAFDQVSRGKLRKATRKRIESLLFDSAAEFTGARRG